jgi:hypothetical protein
MTYRYLPTHVGESASHKGRLINACPAIRAGLYRPDFRECAEGSFEQQNPFFVLESDNTRGARLLQNGGH